MKLLQVQIVQISNVARGFFSIATHIVLFFPNFVIAKVVAPNLFALYFISTCTLFDSFFFVLLLQLLRQQYWSPFLALTGDSEN